MSHAIHMQTIVCHQLSERRLAYGPAGNGPFPSILLLHGSEGGFAGWSHRNAVMLAAHGFLAYPHPYALGGSFLEAGPMKDIPLDRTVDALNLLRAHPFCAGKVGVYGVSRGGEHALLLSSLMARDGITGHPDAVAVHAPADVIVAAFDPRAWRDKGDSSWKVWDPADRAWTWRGTSDDLKPTTPIEIERYAGPLFLSHGTKDEVWDVAMTRRLEARLISNGKMPEIHYYEGQAHGFDAIGENAHLENLVAFFTRHLA